MRKISSMYLLKYDGLMDLLERKFDPKDAINILV